jgi:large subunit ribosomal protein L4e
MELGVYTLTKTELGKKKLPLQFSELIRPDLIARAVYAIWSHRRQPYGTDPYAGLKHSAKISRRRHDYKGSYGHGISRSPRKILSHRGTRFNWVGAEAPYTVGGRRTHPPKAEKIWDEKINKKERKKAIRSALAASLVPQLAEQRGHKVPSNYPFLVEKKFEDIDKTQDVLEALSAFGFGDDLARADVAKIRAGRGKLRGRRYKKRKTLLLVVSKDCKLLRTSSNIPGIDVVEVNKLNAELLAPGAQLGRLTLFTESAIDRIEKEKLFM